LKGNMSLGCWFSWNKIAIRLISFIKILFFKKYHQTNDFYFEIKNYHIIDLIGFLENTFFWKEICHWDVDFPGRKLISD